MSKKRKVDDVSIIGSGGANAIKARKAKMEASKKNKSMSEENMSDIDKPSPPVQHSTRYELVAEKVSLSEL